MGIHFNESKAAIRLEARLGNIAKVLEQRDEIRLRSVGSEIANVACRLPLGRLGHHHVVALDTVGGEVMVPKRSGWRHAHRDHGLLLRDGGLALLVGPVAANGSRAKPLPVHGAEGTIGISAVAESDKAVATRATRLHVPHDASFRHRAKGGEGLEKDLIVDFVGQVADEDVEVAGGVFLGGIIGLVGPVDTDFLA